LNTEEKPGSAKSDAPSDLPENLYGSHAPKEKANLGKVLS